ncbi:sialin isoform X2 [Parasteatoda tepidariorum]|uniref:sialin isoform X2 n=1 Tax=Parasteatoda tepidariorum TaxID=114398 RepID=UPI001C71E3D6|nr:sialin isoform X2 [Parasteatoda tepidariorum]
MPPTYTYGTCEIQNEGKQLFPEAIDRKIFEPIRKKIYCFPKRYIFSVLCFSACCLAVSFNMNLSIAIVSMIKKESNHANNTVIIPTNSSEDSVIRVKEPSLRLSWSSETVGLALGAVYYGQLVSFIPGGRMAELYGGKNMLVGCTMLASLATLLSPFAALWNAYVFVFGRILVGIGTGPIIPIVFHMLARWIPQQERSFHASFIISGYGIGSFLAVIISGALCGTNFLGGWPAVYYIGAISGVIWSFVCVYLMSEAPEFHPNINESELLYIRQNLGAHNTEKNGLLSCLPHLLRAFATVMASYPVDILLKRNLVSVGFVRKGATVINTAVSCGAFIGITYVGRSVTSTTVLFMLAGVLGEFVTFGVCMGCIDIAPNLSGTVSGLLNIVGVFPFFIIPSMVGWLTNYENSIEKWQSVFYVTVIIVCVCTGVFVLFGDLRPQPWGILENNETNSSNISEMKSGIMESDRLLLPVKKDRRLNS